MTQGSRNAVFCTLWGAACVLSTQGLAQDAPGGNTTILTVTDTVATPDIERFGVNLGDVPMKERLPNGGFEGTLYRTIGFGPAGDATSYFDWFGIGSWGRVIKGGNYMFVSGPRKGVKGKVLDIVHEAYPPRPDKGKMTKYIFDTKGPTPTENNGILLEAVDDETGFLGQHGSGYWVFLKGAAIVATEAGDARPGSLGKVAAVLTAPKPGDMAELMAPLGSTRDMDLAGTWRLSLWVKGAGILTLGLGNWFHRVGGSALHQKSVPLTPTWKQHTFAFALDKYPKGRNWEGSLALDLQFTGGTCRLDDLSMVQAGDKNPTAFRDDVVETLKRLHPGTIRFLNMGVVLSTTCSRRAKGVAPATGAVGPRRRPMCGQATPPPREARTSWHTASQSSSACAKRPGPTRGSACREPSTMKR